MKKQGEGGPVMGYGPGTSLTDWTGSIPDTVSQWQARVDNERMPWKASSVMEEKLRFVFEYELRERSMTELCQPYEIARDTGYVWLPPYRQAGAAGLLAPPRAAHRPSNH